MSAAFSSSLVPVASRAGESDADTGADRGVNRAELIGRRQLTADAQRQDARLVAITGDRLDDGEFVAAEPADKVVGPGQGAQPIGDDAQQIVADRMAVGVVDVFEPVEVDDQQRDRRLPPTGLAKASSRRSRMAVRLASPVSGSRRACLEMRASNNAARSASA